MEFTAIGWAVSPFLSFIVNKTLDYLKKPLKLTYGMEADLEKLQQLLPEVQSVVSVAETLKVANRYQADLLRQMKEAVYDAEDVVDEFNYRLLEAEAAKEDSVPEEFGVMVLTAGKRLVGADQLQTSLSKAIKGLERVKQTAQTFMNVTNFEKLTVDAGSSRGRIQPAPYRETDRFRYSDVLGRDKEQNAITEAILQQANESSQLSEQARKISPFGIGKTTLAR